MVKSFVEKSRSYRAFKSGCVITRETLLDLIDTARKCPAAMNTQVLKYRLVTDEKEKSELLAVTRWATRLGIKLPPEGHEPAAYIVICHDKSVADERGIFLYDVGICTQTILLAAAEKGLGGCIIGSASEADMTRVLSLDEKLVPKLIIALGEPDETVILTDAVNGDTAYYRDEKGIHYAPKRTLDEIVIG